MIESFKRHKRSSIVDMVDLDKRIRKLEDFDHVFWWIYDKSITTTERIKDRLDKLEGIHPKNEHVKKESPCTHGVASGRPGWSYKECGDKFCRDCGEEL